MKVAGVEAVPYALRFNEPYVTARGRLERREMVMVRLRADEGLEGLGEAVPLSLRGGASVAAIMREIRESIEPRLAAIDPDEDPASAIESIASGASRPAAAAIEIAGLDLAGKLAGLPVWRLLGAEGAAPVACNATLVAGPPKAVAADARRWSSRGFATFKLKVGVPGDV